MSLLFASGREEEAENFDIHAHILEQRLEAIESRLKKLEPTVKPCDPSQGMTLNDLLAINPSDVK